MPGGQYMVLKATPAAGILYLTENSPDFISGHLRMKGRKGGKYPYKYIEMINRIFGEIKNSNTIEVCSNAIFDDAVTVDINPITSPDYLDDGETLSQIPSNKFNRWRCDPPYNNSTADKMYSTKLPDTSKLLTAGARVCKPGALMFLLLGPQNFQWCPAGVRRIGWISITIVPNNELRALHIFYKS